MELNADNPFLTGLLNYLYQTGIGVYSRTDHASGLKLSFKLVVELIAVAMTLFDMLHPIRIEGFRSLLKFAVECAQTHCAAHVDDSFLLLHDVDYIIGRFKIHLYRVGIFQSQYVAGKFNHHTLHTETDTE